MGNVYRIVFDKRVTQEDLIDQMNKEDPAPIDEKDIPLQDQGQIDETKEKASNQDQASKDIQLVDVERVAQLYIQRCNAYTGQLRLKNERALTVAKKALECLTMAEIKEEIEAKLLHWVERQLKFSKHFLMVSIDKRNRLGINRAIKKSRDKPITERHPFPPAPL